MYIVNGKRAIVTGAAQGIGKEMVVKSVFQTSTNQKELKPRKHFKLNSVLKMTASASLNLMSQLKKTGQDYGILLKKLFKERLIF